MRHGRLVHEWTNGELIVDPQFDNVGDLYYDCGVEYDKTLNINEVKDLMVHLQRALDEHGDKTQ